MLTAAQSCPLALLSGVLQETFSDWSDSSFQSPRRRTLGFIRTLMTCSPLLSVRTDSTTNIWERSHCQRGCKLQGPIETDELCRPLPSVVLFFKLAVHFYSGINIESQKLAAHVHYSLYVQLARMMLYTLWPCYNWCSGKLHTQELSCNQAPCPVSWCDEKMACFEADSSAKCLRSDLKPVAPSVPIFTTTVGGGWVSQWPDAFWTHTDPLISSGLDKHVASPTAVAGRLQRKPRVSKSTRVRRQLHLCTNAHMQMQTAVATPSSGPSEQLVMSV